MPLKIQDPGPGSKLQRLFKVVGRVRPVLEESIIPVVLMDDLTLPSDSDKIAAGYAYQGGAGLSYSYLSLRNPADSGLLVLLDRVVVQSGFAQNVQLKMNQGTLGASTHICYYRDLRQGGEAVAAIRSANLAIVVGNPVMVVRLIANQDRILEVPNRPLAVLSPGTAVIVAAQTVNTSLTAGFYFRERPLS